MKTLKVEHLGGIHRPLAADVPPLLDAAGIGFEEIACAPWAEEYHYQPEVKVRIGITDEAFLLHYVVSEEYVAAAADADNGHVWEDSCCEFFCQPENDGTYYNVECNCMGTLLMGFGSSRDGRQLAPKETLKSIRRWSSLNPEPISNCDNTHIDKRTLPLQKQKGKPWQLALVVPFTAFFRHNITMKKGKIIRANFYKCGDKLPNPHFLAWNDISLPHPNFHCPDHFGTLNLL